MNKKWSCFFLALLAFSLLIKVILALAIPITNDEAYYGVWGRNLAWGYYDHPPLTGWLLNAVEKLGRGFFAIRLPAIVFSLMVACIMWLFLRKKDYVKGTLVASLFVLSPINMLNVIITSDAPLLLFSFLSGLMLYIALRKDFLLYYALSGFFLGCAFLSKYFSALLAITFFIIWLSTPKNPRRHLGFLILLFSAIPSLLLMGWWNYNHGWPNLMFNLVNRNRNEVFKFHKPLVFILMQCYLITPPILYFIWQKRTVLKSYFLKKNDRVFGILFLVPLLLFLLLSLKKNIGLHWVLSFYPFLFLVLFDCLDEKMLLRSLRFMACFTATHLILICSVLLLPLFIFKTPHSRQRVVWFAYNQSVQERLLSFTEKGFQLATESYASCAILEYNMDKKVVVFGEGTYHARQNDMMADFRSLNGSNIVIFAMDKPQTSEYSDYFKKIEIKEITIKKAHYYLILGYDFCYRSYREKILTRIKNNYYRIPKWLPYKNCDFLDRYFPSTLDPE